MQNTTFATAEEARATVCGDVVLVADAATGLVHNAAFEPHKMVYDENYNNEQSGSESFLAHLGAVCRIVDLQFSSRKILEIGCGKGAFLNLIKDRGYSIVGVDPAYDGDDPDIVKAYFRPGLGLTGDAILLRHVLEHIPNPVGFLSEIRDANNGQGLVYIEVPCLEWICGNQAWFDIFYEHVNYFRLSDLKGMFSEVLEAGHLFGDQYIYVVADLASLRTSLRQGAMEGSAFDRLDANRSRFRSLPNHPRAIWGAASKGVIFSKQLLEYGVNVDVAIDINPAKQGRYLPASGLYVASPQEALSRLPEGAEIYVMNSNYLNEIRNAGGDRFIYRTVDSGAPDA